MGQPVKMSDTLVLDARLMGEMLDRSIASQIEFWARLGQAIEPLLKGHEVLALRRAGTAAPLSECLAKVETAKGRKQLAEYLGKQPYPHYEAGPNSLLVRIDADGTRTLGRFVDRKFKVVKRQAK